MFFVSLPGSAALRQWSHKPLLLSGFWKKCCSPVVRSCPDEVRCGGMHLLHGREGTAAVSTLPPTLEYPPTLVAPR